MPHSTAAFAKSPAGEAFGAPKQCARLVSRKVVAYGGVLAGVGSEEPEGSVGPEGD